MIAARDEMQWPDYGPPPLLVKIAPDLEKQDLADIAAVRGRGGWNGMGVVWRKLAESLILVRRAHRKVDSHEVKMF